MKVVYLSYLGKADPPWNGKIWVEAQVHAGAEITYRGKREVPPLLPILYRFFQERGYDVWYVPFEFRQRGEPLSLWTREGAVSLWRPKGARP